MTSDKLFHLYSSIIAGLYSDKGCINVNSEWAYDKAADHLEYYLSRRRAMSLGAETQMTLQLGSIQPIDRVKLKHILADLKSVLCDPNGKACINASPRDLSIIDYNLGELKKVIDYGVIAP